MFVSKVLTVSAVAIASALGQSACHDHPPADVRKELSSETTVSFIDVGKGDCILLENGTQSMLIDTGYKETSGAVRSYLEERDIDELDALVLTHYDKDHVGGTGSVLDAVNVDRILIPPYRGRGKQYDLTMKAIQDSGIKPEPVIEDMSLQLGDARVCVFASPVIYVPNAHGGEGNDNDMSLVATLECGKDSYLFAGDLENDGITAFLISHHEQYDIIKMPHHGRYSKKLRNLLQVVRPRTAIITDSKLEPAEDKTLDLLAKHRVDMHGTLTEGTIVIRSDGHGRYSIVDG